MFKYSMSTILEFYTMNNRKILIFYWAS